MQTVLGTQTYHGQKKMRQEVRIAFRKALRKKRN